MKDENTSKIRKQGKKTKKMSKQALKTQKKGSSWAMVGAMPCILPKNIKIMVIVDREEECI